MNALRVILRRFLSLFALQPRFLLAGALCFLIQPVRADVWGTSGEGAMQRAGNKIPNFKETQNYVKTVMQLYTLLKPAKMLTGQRDSTARVRMQFQGRALNRCNMISSGAPVAPTPLPKTETD